MKRIFIKTALLLCFLLVIPSIMEGCSSIKNKGIEDAMLKTNNLGSAVLTK